MELWQRTVRFGSSTFVLTQRRRERVITRSVDLCNAESIQLLENAGVNFKAHASKGIESRRFGELITMSGLVLSPSITWISFHGIYDFAYLLRILIGCDLPSSMTDFESLMRIFFPHVYDVKAMIMDCKDLNGSINRVAQQTQVGKRFWLDFRSRAWGRRINQEAIVR